MATYKSGQIVYSQDNITLFGSTTASTIVVDEFPRDPVSSEGLDYQQIVIKPSDGSKSFEKGKSYYVNMKIPQDTNFSFDYGLRLLQLPDSRTDLDTGWSDYQLIKYITIPRASVESDNYDTVILFQLREDEGWETIEILDTPDSEQIIVPWTHARVLLDLTNTDLSSIENINAKYDQDYLSDKIIAFIEDNQKVYYWYDHSTYLGTEEDFGKHNILLTYSWLIDSSSQKSTFEFIMTPNHDNLNAIYLCLVPDEGLDRDIQWKRENGQDNTTYYGRYIPNPSENIDVTIYELNNLLQGKSNVTNIGVWGRSELMMAINGSEIKIGPSGYFELQDYDIKSLGIAALAAEDKYTVDYQYQETT